ncbi:MAG: hypothetical protein KDC98_05820 [Planctomycetes bacterium]|nr:hypothetical protein [Planctomycetota bacterium]
MFRPILSVALLSLIVTGCQSTAAAPCAATQAVVEAVAGLNADILRLTVHATPPDGGELQAIASTAPEKLGKPSDAEDLRAIDEGMAVDLDEGSDIDVTVPILKKDGAYTAAVGVTMKGGGDRQKIIAAAKMIAAEVETRLQK